MAANQALHDGGAASGAPVHTLANKTFAVNATHVGLTPVSAGGSPDAPVVKFELNKQELAQKVNELTKGAGVAYNTKTGKAMPVSEAPRPKTMGGLRLQNAQNSDIIVIGRNGPGDKNNFKPWKSIKEQKDSLADAIALVNSAPREVVEAAAKVSNFKSPQMQHQKSEMDKKNSRYAGLPTSPVAPGMGMS